MVPITICKQGQINVTDVDLPSFSQLSGIAEKQKIERESAYHFIKAISHELDVLTSGSLVPVLPTNLSWQTQQPMLTLRVDQGGVGMAAAAFLLKDHMLHTRCDKIHRVVRETKLAIGHAADGLFLKAQLHSGYILSINYKPFNKKLRRILF